MNKNTKQNNWWDYTWNPVTGCSPISEGCLNCWAKRMANRLRGRYGYYKENPFAVTFHPSRLHELIHYRKPQRIFVCSMGDLFHEYIEDEWIMDIFDAMHPDILSPSPHTYLILTKRPKRMYDFFERHGQITKTGRIIRGTLAWQNVWLGVSVENQARADERIPILLSIPAAKHFVSVEPMLGPVSICQWMHRKEITAQFPVQAPQLLNWVICGPETPLRRSGYGGQAGMGARECKPEWIEDLHQQCWTANIPFYDKRKIGWLERTRPK